MPKNLIGDNPALRNALHADEKRVEALLVRIFESKSAEDYVLSLKGDPAQNFLDVVQAALDRGFLIAQKHSQKAGRIIRKLSESCDTLPSSLFVTGVTGREQHPTFGGGYGDIYRASYGNMTVALKHMRHFLRGTDSRSLRLKFCREALVWKDLHHPHILSFIGIDRESFPSSLCMVSPWMEHGTVLQYLKEHGPANVDRLLFEVAQGLCYLHSCDIVHGDLRGTNILVNEDWSACLTDFGLSVFSNASAPMNSQTRAGSILWMAPELIAPDRFGYEFARTPATDVYAFGCVCVELYAGRPPFSELSEGSALLKIINGERAARPSGKPTMSDTLWQHVMEYWAESPVARPTIEAVVQHMVCPGAARPKISRRLRPLPLPNTLRPLPNTPRPPARHDTFTPHRMIKKWCRATKAITTASVAKRVATTSKHASQKKPLWHPITGLGTNFLAETLWRNSPEAARMYHPSLSGGRYATNTHLNSPMNFLSQRGRSCGCCPSIRMDGRSVRMGTESKGWSP
ncbi:kinase-like domain-containing protein [Mycena olivaceomarginata]|nr:kinase-like domain-containing protein [Mycena olivaceomarginata]